MFSYLTPTKIHYGRDPGGNSLVCRIGGLYENITGIKGDVTGFGDLAELEAAYNNIWLKDKILSESACGKTGLCGDDGPTAFLNALGCTVLSEKHRGVFTPLQTPGDPTPATFPEDTWDKWMYDVYNEFNEEPLDGFKSEEHPNAFQEINYKHDHSQTTVTKSDITTSELVSETYENIVGMSGMSLMEEAGFVSSLLTGRDIPAARLLYFPPEPPTLDSDALAKATGGSFNTVAIAFAVAMYWQPFTSGHFLQNISGPNQKAAKLKALPNQLKFLALSGVAATTTTGTALGIENFIQTNPYVADLELDSNGFKGQEGIGTPPIDLVRNLLFTYLMFNSIKRVEFLMGFKDPEETKSAYSHNRKLLRKPLWGVLDANAIKNLSGSKALLCRIKTYVNPLLGLNGDDNNPFELPVYNEYFLLCEELTSAWVFPEIVEPEPETTDDANSTGDESSGAGAIDENENKPEPKKDSEEDPPPPADADAAEEVTDVELFEGSVVVKGDKC